jgi:hypothetical protein
MQPAARRTARLRTDDAPGTASDARAWRRGCHVFAFLGGGGGGGCFGILLLPRRTLEPHLAVGIRHVVPVHHGAGLHEDAVIVGTLVPHAAWDGFGKVAPAVIRLAARTLGEGIHGVVVQVDPFAESKF